MKQKYPRVYALAAARELVGWLRPVVGRMVVAGSLRRRKEQVGDVEIVYVPHLTPLPPDGLFASPDSVAGDILLTDRLLAEGKLSKRVSEQGRTAWGPSNKLAVHVASRVPVDLFATTEEAWWSYLVCRTGSAETNIRLAAATKARGWHWNPYRGFTDPEGRWHFPQSEQAVFDLAGVAYLEPWER